LLNGELFLLLPTGTGWAGSRAWLFRKLLYAGSFLISGKDEGNGVAVGTEVLLAEALNNKPANMNEVTAANIAAPTIKTRSLRFII